MEPAEDFFTAAHRETLEESGIPIELEGILRVEHSPAADGSARMRVIFLARPADDRPPKSMPDAESLEARWVVLAGAPVYPISLRQPEGRRLSTR